MKRVHSFLGIDVVHSHCYVLFTNAGWRKITHPGFCYSFTFFSTVCTPTDRSVRGPSSGPTRDAATDGRRKAARKAKGTPKSGLKGTGPTLEENLSPLRLPELSV